MENEKKNEVEKNYDEDKKYYDDDEKYNFFTARNITILVATVSIIIGIIVIALIVAFNSFPSVYNL